MLISHSLQFHKFVLDLKVEAKVAYDQKNNNNQNLMYPQFQSSIVVKASFLEILLKLHLFLAVILASIVASFTFIEVLVKLLTFVAFMDHT